MNVSELPLELINEILKRLDAISLAKSRQVCRSWRALHFQPKYKLVWKSACFRDIDRDVLIELTGNGIVFGGQDTSTLHITDNFDWEAIYREWYRCRHVGKWPSMRTELRGHKGPVWDAKFSGDRVITCGEDGTVRIWDSWTNHCINTLLAHRAAVHSIALRQIPGMLHHTDTPHDLIVSGSKDCAVKVWDLKTHNGCLLTLHGHTACINCVAVQSNFAASASDDCSVRLWDLTTGECCHVLSNLGDWVKFVRLWQQDTLLYVTDNGLLCLWSISCEKPISSISLTQIMANSSPYFTPGVQGAILRGETSLVLTHSHGLFSWHSKPDGSVVHNFSVIGQHTNNVERGECLAMHGALVAIGTRSGAVYIHHLDGDWKDQFNEVHCVLHGSHSAVSAVDLDDDGEGPALVTAGDDGIVRVYRWFPPSFQDSKTTCFQLHHN